MSIRTAQRLLIGTVLLLAAPALAETNFKTWLNQVIVELKTKAKEDADRARVAVSVRSNTNQDEAPSMSANTSSLVDTSSASDLVGVALNLAGLSGSTQSSNEATDTTTTAATVSAYALYSAVQGADPLDPGRYCAPAAQWARSLSITLGYDDQSSDMDGSSPIIAGAKVLLPWLNSRNVCDDEAFEDVTRALIPAAERYANIDMKVADRFYDAYGVAQTKLPSDVRAEVDEKLKQARNRALAADPPDDANVARKIEFLNLLNDPVFFEAYLAALGDQAIPIVVDAVGPQGLDPFIHLDEQAAKAIEEFQEAPQIAFSFLTKQREDGSDDYQGQAILDIGLARRLNLTVNGSYEGSRGGMQSASNGGRVAAQVQFQPLSDDLSGPKTLRLSLGFDGAWKTGGGPTYKGQFKINLPVPRIQALAGLEFPLSVTVANRSELIDETEVVGLVGFTLDTSQVLAGLLGI